MNTETITRYTIEQVRNAQRTAPNAPETRALQSAYEKQRLAALAARRAAKYRDEQARMRITLATLRAEIIEAGKAAQAAGTREGFRLRYVTRGRAEDLMGAPAAFGGWIAVSLPRVLHDSQEYFAALLPDGMNYGLPMSPLTLATAWAEELCPFDEDGPKTVARWMIAKIQSIHA